MRETQKEMPAIFNTKITKEEKSALSSWEKEAKALAKIEEKKEEGKTNSQRERSSSSSLDSSQSSTNSAPARLEGNSDDAKKGNTRKKPSKKSKRKASRKEAVKKEIETRSRAQSDPISVAPKVASQRARSESNPINPTRNENSMAGSGGISKRGNISAMVASTRKLIDGVNTKWATKSKAEKASTTQNNGRTR